MKRVLGRKQSTDNATWLEAMAHIEDYVTRQEVESYAEWAVERIREAIVGKTAAYAWSGGKDSIVLGDLCQRAGLSRGFFAYSDLDYPEFVRWCMKHKPQGVEPMHTGYNLDWLAQHQELIFATGQLGQRWHLINQRGPFTDMYFRHRLDVLIVGHRVIDGNVCGNEGLIKRNTGEKRYAPIFDWSHELLLGYIHYNELPLPPIYGWKDGFVQGTHAWPERNHCTSLRQGYSEVYDIAPSIIVKAAEKIPSAADFLRERERATSPKQFGRLQGVTATPHAAQGEVGA